MCNRPTWIHSPGKYLILVTLLAHFAITSIAAQNPKPQALRVLFIGNSYTYFNNLGALVTGIAASSSGRRIEAALAVKGGATLSSLLSDAQIQQWVGSGEWDWIVLQEQSQLGVGYLDGPKKLGSSDDFHRSVRRWVRRIRQTGAKPLLFMTWARRDFPVQTQQLADAYRAIGEELGVAVAPVGIAWSDARKQNLQAQLYIDDGSHPSPTGSYLAGCVLAASLTGESPIGAQSTILGQAFESQAEPGERNVILVDLRVELAKSLQRIGWAAVQSEASFNLEPPKARQSMRATGTRVQ